MPVTGKPSEKGMLPPSPVGGCYARLLCHDDVAIDSGHDALALNCTRYLYRATLNKYCSFIAFLPTSGCTNVISLKFAEPIPSDSLKNNLKMPAVLGYWNLRGLAQSIRLLLEYTGEDYNEKLYDITGEIEEWTEDKFNLGMSLPNLPYYFDGLHKITQSNAIMRYIGRKHDLCGKTEEEIIKVDMLENQAMDIRMAWVKLVYNVKEFDADKQTYINETLPTMLELLNNFIGHNKWFVGNNITIVDFLFYELFDINKHLAAGCLKKFKNLQEFVTRFESQESIKKYMKSPKFISKPLNGPMAVFGGK